MGRARGAGGRGGRAVAWAALLLVPLASRPDDAASPPAAPIPWQDDGPFAQLFLQLPFDAPEPVEPGRLEVSLRTLYSNSIARERAANLSVDVSIETAAPIGFVRFGLPRGFELQLSVPGAVDYAGFLARPIKFVDDLFDCANPLRAGRPPTSAHFRILRPNGAGLDWSGTGGSVADPWLGLKHRVRTQDEWTPALSWRLALALPTAPLPLGSGRFELGVGLLAGWTFADTSLRLEADAMLPDGRPITAADVQTRPHFGLQLGVARRLAPWATAMVQASAHTSAITGTGVDAIEGTSTYLLAGIRLEPTRSTSIAFALVENVLHATRGADISAVLELAWRR